MRELPPILWCILSRTYNSVYILTDGLYGNYGNYCVIPM